MNTASSHSSRFLSLLPSVPRRRIMAAFCLVCGLLMAVQGWLGRDYMNPDGISYLDVADRLAARDFAALAHPYWSPGYPCLLAAGLKLFPSGPSTEFPVVHAVNWAIGLAALGAFTFFLLQWPAPGGTNQESGARLAIDHTGYCVQILHQSGQLQNGRAGRSLMVAAP